MLSACAAHEPRNQSDLKLERLPPPDVTLSIPGLGPCTDKADRSLRLNSHQPVNVLVHGCFGSSGEFRSLAQVLAFHGQQSACFTYDDRAKLTNSATALRRAITQLAEQSRITNITVIGHSQGALIAHNALTESPRAELPGDPAGIRLVTVSGPFAGIEAARTCGKSWLYPVTLGLLPLSCYLATGPKWTDITYSSRFIREPGALDEKVTRYLKIDTDERGTCRREQSGRCIESDDVFSLAEQHNALIETDSRVKSIAVNAGHVEIIGDRHVAPTKLIAILQDEGVLYPTPPMQLSAFSVLLSQIYQGDESLARQP